MKKIKNYLINSIKNNKGFILLLVGLVAARWSFIDQYRVPSASMFPTIHIGDYVFVNKMAYDIKLPFTDIVITTTSIPERGDIIVFKYPKEPSTNYVKRLIAIPGDHVEIYNGMVKINGKSTLKADSDLFKFIAKLKSSTDKFTYKEELGNKEYTIQRIPQNSMAHKMSFTVPKDKYFFMGDNRDNSSDSRFWGYVPRNYFKGKVKNVTMSVAFDGIIPNIAFKRFGMELI